MKPFLFVGLVSALFLSIACETFGELTPSKMTSTTQPSSKIEGLKPMEPVKQPPPSPSRQPLPPPPVRAPSFIPQQAEYLHPGILVFLNGRWEGSDHLLNLTPNIGVYVSIIKPENEAIEINEAQIQKEVENLFTRANIRPQTLAGEGRAPLPAFEIEIFIYPIERGYTAFCQGRLFESVTLERFKMDPNMVFQAITWEKQHLIVSPKAQFAEQLVKTVEDIVTTFTERFQAYARVKKGIGF